MIGDDIRTYMLTQSAITDLTSVIQPVILDPRPGYPAIVYRDIEHDESETFGGQPGFTQSDIEYDAWGETYADAVSLAAAIRSTLKNLTGTVGTIYLQRSILVSGPVAIYEESVNCYRITQVFRFTHNEG